jgi:predicted MFS family arabinose efflux permease
MTRRSRPPWLLYSPRQRWWYLTLLFLVTTSNYFDQFVVSVVLDPIKKEFQVSDTRLGLLTGLCFSLIYALSAIPIARWADRGNRRAVTTVTLIGWSVMTAACGLAMSFGQLVIARMGVALTEPGAAPPAQSLIVDYFPPERRATAVAILVQCGSAAGYCVGIVLGGYIAAIYGWRNAFLVAGLPGLVLALLVHFTLAEPRCQIGFPAAKPNTESMRESLSKLRGTNSYLFILVGYTVYAIYAYGISVFMPSFMIRSLHASLEQVSVTWGVGAAIAMFSGAMIGGGLADRLINRDIRWCVWLPAIACVTGLPIYWLALSANSLTGFIAAAFPAELILAIVSSIPFAALHLVCGHSRRALAVAIAYFLLVLVGGGCGPLLAGVLSDAWSVAYQTESLRYSMRTLLLFLIPASAAFLWAARTMHSDARAAQGLERT